MRGQGNFLKIVLGTRLILKANNTENFKGDNWCHFGVFIFNFLIPGCNKKS